jgi:hypothetical protein
MLVARTSDGVYRVCLGERPEETSVEKILDPPRVERVEWFDGVDRVFAATRIGLYHWPDGTAWADLGVPEETSCRTVRPD